MIGQSKLELNYDRPIRMKLNCPRTIGMRSTRARFIRRPCLDHFSWIFSCNEKKTLIKLPARRPPPFQPRDDGDSSIGEIFRRLPVSYLTPRVVPLLHMTIRSPSPARSEYDFISGVCSVLLGRSEVGAKCFRPPQKLTLLASRISEFLIACIGSCNISMILRSHIY